LLVPTQQIPVDVSHKSESITSIQRIATRRALLNKPWNPYVHRHSAITEKSGIISSDQKLKQFAGWTSRSNTHHKYVHFRGNESQDDLLRAKGIIKDNKESMNILQPKPCPNCREPNKPDSHLCHKCGFTMSFQAYRQQTGL
jgi:hypothetical protein